MQRTHAGESKHRTPRVKTTRGTYGEARRNGTIRNRVVRVGEPRRVAGAVKQGRRQATAKARNAAPTFPRGAGGQRRRRATMAGLPFVGRLGWTRVPARFWGGGGE
jgi:hypothetical protein